MEFTLSNALSSYINLQLQSGRLNPHIHASISDAWAQKGRPKVIGFRYDLETQLDMVAEHIGSFRFGGPHQQDTNMIKGLLYGMKMNARVMRVRTFCQPDPVIAKHILDSQALLQLLDAADPLQVTLEEVSQFFKAILEREKALREQRQAKRSFTGGASRLGTVSRGRDGSSPAKKDKLSGEFRIPNRINTPAAARTFSGPTLEEKAFDPSQSFVTRAGESYKQQRGT
ncbi:hypothetical protein GGS26DRAFT_49370 [Hypomontagnella submonticulosa]|nr:hypothetical protein GGS26DRAFT_49370 [Hypomontagnella submonticulosa]